MRGWLAALAVLISVGAAAQTLQVVHIRITLVDAAQHETPVPRHALLISDDPPTSTPRRVVTSLDGTVDVRLRPGHYTIESDQAVAFGGKAYTWTELVEVVAGQDLTLDLNADKAGVEAVTADTPAANAAVATDSAMLVGRWMDGVVGVWTPTAHASGFVVDPQGLVVTNARTIGDNTPVEVQLTPTVKVAAQVLEADDARDVAVLRVAPESVSALPVVPTACADATEAIADGQKMYAIGAPFNGDKRLAVGFAERIDTGGAHTDFRLPEGSAGGPVFSASGDLIGLTAISTDSEVRRDRAVLVVHIAAACRLLARTREKLDGPPPAATHLPVDPATPVPAEVLKRAEGRAVALGAYRMSASDFDITFITPVQAYAARQQADGRRDRDYYGIRAAEADRAGARALLDFANWSDYVSTFPAVLLIRVTPRLVEGFWTTIARGAAYTQGVAVPAIKHFKPGFLRMRVFCGSTEVTPIHPFVLEQPVSETESMHEGLYALAPDALGPQCDGVKLELYAEKDPAKSDTRTVDPRLLEQVRRDFMP